MVIVPLSLAALHLGLTQNPFAYETVPLSGCLRSPLWQSTCSRGNRCHLPPLRSPLWPSMCGYVNKFFRSWCSLLRRAIGTICFAFCTQGTVNCSSQGDLPPLCIQTARLLFRMSLFHLPLYLLLFVLHRVPNHGQLTWQSVMNVLQRSSEDVEQQILHTVHGPRTPQRAPARYVEGPMLFPFSPPLFIPCPYHEVKRRALSSIRSRQEDIVARASESDEHEQLGKRSDAEHEDQCVPHAAAGSVT